MGLPIIILQPHIPPFRHRSPTLATVLFFALIHSPNLHAQEQQDTDNIAHQHAPNAQNTPDIAPHIVTGQLINFDSIIASHNIVTISAQDIDFRQPANIEELLREIPGITPSFGAQVNNSYLGSTTVDVRGIGRNRNLVLLNDMRMVPAGLDNVANIDIVPMALLNNVDILRSGAGTVYGADAISGVVNFKTAQRFTGITGEIGNHITEYGDGYQFRADLTAGMDFADGRGNISVNLGYHHREAISQGDRDFSKDYILSNNGHISGSSTTVPTTLIISGIDVVTNPVTGEESDAQFGFYQVTPDGESFGGYHKGFNFNPFNQFQSPQEQYRVFANLDYEFSDQLRLSGSGYYANSKTNVQIAPIGTFFEAINVPLNNVYLTDTMRNQLCGRDTSLYFPDDPSTAANEENGLRGVQRFLSQAECDAAGATPFGAMMPDPNNPGQMIANPDYREASLELGRRFAEHKPRALSFDTDIWQGFIGLFGDLDNGYQWHFRAGYGESKMAVLQSGNVLRSRLEQSLGAVETSQCLDDSNSCVPVNLFGDMGSITPDMLNFVSKDTMNTTRTSLLQLQGQISGDIGFILPWTDQNSQFAIGAEYRDYHASAMADPTSQILGEIFGYGTAEPNISGQFDVFEIYGEAMLPIASDRPWLSDLRFTMGGRYSHYSTTGSEWNWKAGLIWALSSEFQLESHYQRVTRAPNIAELYTPTSSALRVAAPDPCTDNAPLIDPNLAAICLAQGAKAEHLGNIRPSPDGQFNSIVGGNPDLDSEKADNWTVGLSYQPQWFDGFSLALTYYSIAIKNAIARPTVRDAMGACFGEDFYLRQWEVDAQSASNPACTAIRRNPDTGNLHGELTVTPGLLLDYRNEGKITTTGFDVELGWQGDMGFARVNWSLYGNWARNTQFKNIATSPERDCSGIYGANCTAHQSIISKRSLASRLTFSRGAVDLSLYWRWKDKATIEEDEVPFILGGALTTEGAILLPPEGSNYSDFTFIGDTHYFDLSMAARLTQWLDISASITNIFDNKPKIIGSTISNTAFNHGNIYPSSYDPLGRRFTVTMTAHF